MPRKLSEIAAEIRADWQNMDVYAKQYVNAMAQMSSINDRYMADDAEGIVLYFLSNASKWRGDVARRVKKELNDMLKSIK